MASVDFGPIELYWPTPLEVVEQWHHEGQVTDGTVLARLVVKRPPDRQALDLHPTFAHTPTLQISDTPAAQTSPWWPAGQAPPVRSTSTQVSSQRWIHDCARTSSTSCTSQQARRVLAPYREHSHLVRVSARSSGLSERRWSQDFDTTVFRG
jgi:hypothetical protein